MMNPHYQAVNPPGRQSSIQTNLQYPPPMAQGSRSPSSMFPPAPTPPLTTTLPSPLPGPPPGPPPMVYSPPATMPPPRYQAFSPPQVSSQHPPPINTPPQSQVSPPPSQYQAFSLPQGLPYRPPPINTSPTSPPPSRHQQFSPVQTSSQHQQSPTGGYSPSHRSSAASRYAPPPGYSPSQRPPLDRWRSRSHDRGSIGYPSRPQHHHPQDHDQSGQDGPGTNSRSHSLPRPGPDCNHPPKPDVEYSDPYRCPTQPPQSKKSEPEPEKPDPEKDGVREIEYSDPYNAGRTFKRQLPIPGHPNSPLNKASTFPNDEGSNDRRSGSQSRNGSQQGSSHNNRDFLPKPLRKVKTDGMKRKIKHYTGAEAADDGGELVMETFGKIGEVL